MSEQQSSQVFVPENSETIIVDLDCGTGGNTDVGLDICAAIHADMNTFGEDTEKPSEITLTLGDTLTNEINSTQGDKLEVGNVMTGDDGDGSYFIRVSDSDKPGDTDGLYFSGDVRAGESFTAIGNDGKFGSETFVHIFSSDGGTLLQTINFHTSCSAPLVIGDQYGSVSLTGAAVEGKDTGTVYQIGSTEAAGDEGVTYSIKDDGDMSKLFQVNADGEVSFIDAPDFENPQGINGTNNYEVVVLCETADGVEEKIIEICVEDDCIKITENSETIIVDLDCGTGGNTDVGLDICAVIDKDSNTFGEDTEKPSEITLTLGDTLTNEINSTQGDKLEVGNVMSGDDGDGMYFIRVSDSDKPGDTDGLYFSGDVGAGDSFTAIGNDGKFGSETFVHIFSSDGGTLLQTINFHTSCSAPLVIGDQYGSVSLTGAAVEGKDTGTIYQIGSTEAAGDEGVTYSIKDDGDMSKLFQVNADGEVSFIDAPDFENPQGINGTNNYEVVVLCETADGVEEKIIEICVEDDCIKITENSETIIVDLDCGTGGNTDVGLDICAVIDKDSNTFGEDTEKPSEITLTLGDTLTNEINSTQGDKLEVGNVMSGDDGDGMYFIRVSDSDKPGDTDGLYFSGDVGAGDSFTAIGNDGKFGSETFVHIFSSDGGTLLQTINFHTSCSAPLVIGDQYGSVSLTGAAVEGKDTGTIYQIGSTEAAGDEGVTYSIKDDGDMSKLFQVNADGEVSFIDAPDFENPQGINGTNNYEVVVLCETADGVEEKIIEICVEDELDKVCVDENTSPQPIVNVDLTVSCPVPGANDGEDICAVLKEENNSFGEDTEKPSEITLTLGDTLTNEINSTQGDKLEVGNVMSGDDGDGSYFIRVSDSDKPGDTDGLYFSGDVRAGESFTAIGNDGKFGSETFVHIFSSDGGTLLQTINFHTSCSAPLVIGDQYGSVSLTGAAVEGKDTGTVYQLSGTTMVELGEGDITYSLSGADADLFNIDPETGEITFKAAPDFENPEDVGKDNLYNVTVRAEAKTDPTCFTEKPIEICVEDVPEFGSLSGRYFCDTNDNDLDDGQTVDPGVVGVVVTVFDAAGNEVDSTVTGDDGTYAFNGLPAGTYSVVFSDPDAVLAGKTLVTPNVGADETIDSDAVGDVSSSTIAGIVVQENAETADNDAGAEIADTGTAAIEGRVFCDENDNDVRDAGDVDVSGVTVELLDGAGNPVLDGVGDPVTTTTAADGTYSFTELDAGDYQVRFPTAVDGKVLVDENDPNGNGDDTNDSDADQSTGTTGVITVGIGETSSNNDAGVEDPGTAAIEGRVFCDENDNDVRDAGDVDVSGVTVELLDGAGNPVLDGVGDPVTTTTAADGTYSFTELDAGDYQVRFPTAVDGKVLVDENDPNGNGDDTNDSDADQSTGTTGVITVGIGETSSNNDAGVEDPGTAAIEGRVFCDENDNDVRDAGDVDVSGVTVELLDGAGNPVLDGVGDPVTTTTAADGTYSFTELDAGDYRVRFPTAVDGKVLVDENDPNGNGDDTNDSDADQGTGTTGVITVGIGETSSNNDAGVEDPGTAAIEGRYFCDENDDDVDNGEPGIFGAVVTLLDGTGHPVIVNGSPVTTTTDSNGNYAFTGLLAGTYGVLFAAEANGKEFVAQNDPNGNGDDTNDSDVNGDGLITGIVLELGETSENNDAGVEDPGTASVGDKVFFDANGNGLQDTGEAGVEGVDVILTGAGDDGIIGTGDDTTQTRTTDVNGMYMFEDLNAGDYKITFDRTTTGDLVFTTKGTAPTDEVANDSDADEIGMTDVFTLDIGEAELDIDAGLVDPGTAALGDRVFIDANGNGQQDIGEAGLDDVLVTLFNADGSVAETAFTENGGMYLFDNLKAGDYTVGFAEADMFDFTVADQGDDATDSDADQVTGRTGTITLGVGEVDLTVDAGLVAENNVPMPQDDMGMTCADEKLTLNVLANDGTLDTNTGGILDADGDTLTITQVDGKAIVDGGAAVMTGAGTLVSLVGGQLVFDGEAAYAALDIGKSVLENISYTVSDGTDTADANVAVKFCGDANTYASLAETFPTNGTYQVVSGTETTPAGDFAFTVKIDGTGDDRFDGMEFGNAYCLSATDAVLDGSAFSTAPENAGDILSAEGPESEGVFDPSKSSFFNGQSGAENLDLISYIVAQDHEGAGTYDGWDVQWAIWELTDGFNSDAFIPGGVFEGLDSASVDAILADAAANGEGFSFGNNGTVGAIIDPNPATDANSQPFIVGFLFEDYDCIC